MNKIEAINYQNVTHLISEKNYTRLYFVDGKFILIPHTLKRFEEKICNEPNFTKINRGIIININFLIELTEDEVLLSCGIYLPISRRRSKLIAEKNI
jgi:DNA-binding LytR/AlgR family response regulator